MSRHEDTGTEPLRSRARSSVEPGARTSGALLSLRHALLVAIGLALPGLVALLLRAEPPATPAPVAAAVPSSAGPREAGSPVRVCVLPFKNLGREEALAVLQDGLAESVVTDFGQHSGFRLIERGLLELDFQELTFSQSSHVDPATRAQLGRIVGAEVVVLGSYQRAGDVLRATARFVHVETGEVLETARVEGPAAEPLALQDALAARVKALLPMLQRRMRT
ncbi:hypothetical protein BO221_26750 [Archangium sp. Cb G35]|uniref:CsgG/HfaB family protein n=1 Tax=Archangium sp. Cb G35 TaxID=1920190 RepID=UPI0009360EF2|nr:CsgG/HfaB family protein [Archangium sp. Cb G35]OJT21423.1 hypothetical protein BO221_26750 [Archangium sp. Cb G35]